MAPIRAAGRTAAGGIAALPAFLAQASRQPFVWGRSDCWLFMADWVALAHGVDPGDGFRGTYSSAHQALALIKRHGGHRAFAGDLLIRAGLIETIVAQEGDVALVRAPVWRGDRVRMVPVGAIRTRLGWAIRPELPASIVEVPANTLPLIAAWRIV